MRVHRPFWSAGCARSVNDHEWILGAGPFSRCLVRKVSPVRLDNEVPFGFRRHKFPSPVETFAGNQRFRTGIPQARFDGLLAETGEQRQEDAADLADGEHGDDALRIHRHEHADRVALAQSYRAQTIRRLVHLSAQLGVRQRPRVSGFILVPDRNLGTVFETTLDDVQLATDAPPRPLDAARQIDDRRVRLVEVDVELLQHRVPKPCDIGDRTLLEFIERPESVPVHEPLQIALGN